ncbi:hypothetical protein Plhal304r1_c053g0138051 [Plasmopara halstedii]
MLNFVDWNYFLVKIAKSIILKVKVTRWYIRGPTTASVYDAPTKFS